MSVPDTVRHGVARGDLRELSRGRLQLPDDRHAGGGRPRAADAAGGDRRRAPAASPASTRRGSPAIDGVDRSVEPAWARTNWQSYCVELSGIVDQRAVMQRMLDAGVVDAARRHELAPGGPVPIGCRRRRPAAERAARSERGVILPLAPAMTMSQIAHRLRRAGRRARIRALIVPCPAQLAAASTPTVPAEVVDSAFCGRGAGPTHLRPDPEVVGDHRRIVGDQHRRQHRARQGDGVVARSGRRRPGRSVQLGPRPDAQHRRHGDQQQRRASDCRSGGIGRRSARGPHGDGAAADIDVSRPDRRGPAGRVLPPVSEWTFGTHEYAVPVAVLSLAVWLPSISDGQAALIQGMRRIADLARIGVLAAVFWRDRHASALVYFLRE